MQLPDGTTAVLLKIPYSSPNSGTLSSKFILLVSNGTTTNLRREKTCR
jgi:hypothetical protein